MANTCVLLVSEGPHELGRYRDAFAPADDLPALATLVKRLLEASGQVRFFCRTGSTIRNVHRGKMATRLGKKVFSALWYARNARDEPLDAVVFVVDRDGPRNAARIREMSEGRERYGPTAVPCALGLAIETFDAWMICDAQVIAATGGNGTKAHDHPESLWGGPRSERHPKRVADTIFGTRRGTGLGPKYRMVAEKVDLSLLERACPNGFKPFAGEVRGRVGPVVSRHAN